MVPSWDVARLDARWRLGEGRDVTLTKCGEAFSVQVFPGEEQCKVLAARGSERTSQNYIELTT